MKRSDISGFHSLKPEERMAMVKEFAGLTDEETAILMKSGALDVETAGRMSENTIGTAELPFGIATNFLINGKDYLIPMAIDEPSVVAAASNSAKIARPSGGFRASSDESVMIGQIQLIDVPDLEEAKRRILENKTDILKMCDEKDSTLLKYGGGARDIEVREIDTIKGKMLIVHLLINVADAYGPNLINTMSEYITPFLEELSRGKARLRIISNLADKRIARTTAVWKKDDLEASMHGVDMKGEEIVDAIMDAYAFAAADPYRAATHNKGIMNGIDAVAIATSNDWRGLEAGAHAYAAMTGKYLPLTRYRKNENGDLEGSIELPVPVGVVGGSINTNPVAKVSLKILGVKSARELSEVIASVGLAQNFAAIRALSTEGLQRGHMKLHARNIAAIAGAEGPLIDLVAERIVEEKNIMVCRAQQVLEELKQ
jgi:hydroxymethylglutaryl-CoA reductase